ncbi:MAG: hypothetical protein K6F00_07420 [Lachnospiraceae bacterium]|nr:hypothetical protein [Lachnospiraceae bacterium]
MLKNKFVIIAINVVVFIALFNLLDFLWATFVSKTDFVFSPGKGIVQPLIMALVISTFGIITLNKKNPDDKTE